MNKEIIGDQNQLINLEVHIVGVKNPVIDEVIENLVSSKNRKELINYTRVLDRSFCLTTI